MKKISKAKALMNLVDAIFVVSGEMIEENGEDSYFYSINDDCGIIGVCDGCGGIGSRKYSEYNNKSGAYIASRVVSHAILEWFDNSNVKKLSVDIAKQMCKELSKSITHELKSYESNTRKTVIKGSLSKSFPTTTSAIYFTNKNDVMHAAFIWAGDSRGFVLNRDGLTQITTDDIDGEVDAMLNISEDSKLTNVISASGKFILNTKVSCIEKPGIFVTATDGCFGYFSTPMEFEYMLIETLMNSNSIEQWKDKLHSYIRKYTADDYTMGVVVFGFGNFKKFKKSFAERRKTLKNKYINKLKKADKLKTKQIWNEYKDYYYRGVKADGEYKRISTDDGVEKR